MPKRWYRNDDTDFNVKYKDAAIKTAMMIPMHPLYHQPI